MEARRTLTSANGAMRAAQRRRDILLTDTPLGNGLTTIAVHDRGLSQAEVEGLATFEADGLPAR